METSEKLVFLKREEIKTMAKDLARLQEEEALHEKERVGKLKVEEKIKQETLEREKIASTMIPKEAGTKEKKTEIESLLPKAAPASTPQKILVRVLIVFLFLAFLLLITFGYWLLFARGKNPPQSSPTPGPSGTSLPTPTPSLPPAPVIPAALLPVKETKILEISPDNDLSKLLTGTLATTLSTEPTPEFFQLAIVKNDLFLGMGDFFKELGVTLPIGFSDSVSPQTEDFTFFLYAKSGENRLGLIVKTSDAAKTSAELKAWELSLPTDLANLFALQGKSGAAAGKFREARYQGVPFRYLSFAEKNLGVCWAIYNDYLILTSSGEGLVRTIDLLKKP